MSPNLFEQLLSMVAPYLIKNCRNREPVSPEEQLVVTLHHLVTGDAHTTIAMSFRLSHTTVGRIILETSTVIRNVLTLSGYFSVPSN